MVSINCITYNHEDFIAEAMNSFLAQKTNFRYEILIHDDASTDKTSEIIRKYQEKFPELIKPIIQEENKYSKGNIKISYEYNHKRANGKYIAFCEGDDYWTDPYKLQKQVDYMEKNPQCTLCTHSTTIMKGGSNNILGVVRPFTESRIINFEDILLGGGGFFATNSLLYLKSAFDTPPQFFFDSPVGDYPMQIILSELGEVFYIDEIMSAYRFQTNGSWSQNINNTNDQMINLDNQLINMLEKLNIHTNKKYESTIYQVIKQHKFNINRIEGNLKEIRLPIYRDLYNNLTNKEKTKIILKNYLPYLKKILNEYKLKNIQKNELKK